MPQERSDMRRVKEVLRLAHELGYSNRQIRSRSGWAGRRLANIGTGPRGWRALRRCGRDGGDGGGGAAVQAPQATGFCAPCPTGAEVAAELRKPAVTLQLVWQEYRDRHADGYCYSQFPRALPGPIWKLDAEPAHAAHAFARATVRGRLRRDDHDGHCREWRTPDRAWPDMVAFAYPGSIAFLSGQLERRLKKVHEQPDRPIKPRQGCGRC